MCRRRASGRSLPASVVVGSRTGETANPPPGRFVRSIYTTDHGPLFTRLKNQGGALHNGVADNMALIVLRLFFLLCAGGVSAVINTSLPSGGSAFLPWLNFVSIMGLAVVMVIFDIYLPCKRIDTITSVYFGVLIGVLLTYILTIAAAPLLDQLGNAKEIRLVLGLLLCYLCTSVLLQTK